MTVTRSGRHAAGRPPSRALPVVGAAFLLALAAGGWSLFAQTPSEAEQLALAGEQSTMVLPPALRTVTAAPARPEGGARRPSRPAGPGSRPHEDFEADEEYASHPMITPPEVPTVVVPTAAPRASRARGPRTPAQDHRGREARAPHRLRRRRAGLRAEVGRGEGPRAEGRRPQLGRRGPLRLPQRPQGRHPRRRARPLPLHPRELALRRRHRPPQRGHPRRADQARPAPVRPRRRPLGVPLAPVRPPSLLK